MNHRGPLTDGAPAYTGPATPLRSVLVGEHAARALDWLTAIARPDSTGRLVLDMPLPEARGFVEFADAWCDQIDQLRERQPRDRVDRRAAPNVTRSRRSSHFDVFHESENAVTRSEHDGR